MIDNTINDDKMIVSGGRDMFLACRGKIIRMPGFGGMNEVGLGMV